MRPSTETIIQRISLPTLLTPIRKFHLNALTHIEPAALRAAGSSFYSSVIDSFFCVFFYSFSHECAYFSVTFLHIRHIQIDSEKGGIKLRNRCMFEKMAAGIALASAVMAGAAMLPGSGHGLVVKAYAADVSNQNSQNISGGVPGVKMA